MAHRQIRFEGQIVLLFVAVVIQNDEVRIVALDPLYLQKGNGSSHAMRVQGDVLESVAKVHLTL